MGKLTQLSPAQLDESGCSNGQYSRETEFEGKVKIFIVPSLQNVKDCILTGVVGKKWESQNLRVNHIISNKSMLTTILTFCIFSLN